MKTCEVCGKAPARITEGPFSGDYAMHDYCEHCSKDLCDACMKEGHCRMSPDGKHHASGESEGQE